MCFSSFHLKPVAQPAAWDMDGSDLQSPSPLSPLMLKAARSSVYIPIPLRRRDRRGECVCVCVPQISSIPAPRCQQKSRWLAYSAPSLYLLCTVLVHKLNTLRGEVMWYVFASFCPNYHLALINLRSVYLEIFCRCIKHTASSDPLEERESRSGRASYGVNEESDLWDFSDR